MLHLKSYKLNQSQLRDERLNKAKILDIPNQVSRPGSQISVRGLSFKEPRSTKNTRYETAIIPSETEFPRTSIMSSPHYHLAKDPDT